MKLYLKRIIRFTALTALTASTALACLTTTLPLNARETLTLSQAIEKGLENNFQIRIARQNTAIAKNNNSWGAAGRYPSISLALDSANSLNDTPSVVNPDNREKYMRNTLTPSIRLNWTLFNGFAVNITKAKLAHLNEISEGNAAIVVENTIQAIVLAYYKTLLEMEKTTIIKEVMKLSKDRYDYVLSKKDVGAATTYDALQAKIAFLNDQANLLRQELNLKSAQRNLNLVLGEPAEKDYSLSGEFKAEMKNYSLNDLTTKLKTNNKTLKNQYINQAILKQDISLQRSNLYPTVALTSGANRTGTHLKYDGTSDALNSHSLNYYVNFSVNLNLFNGGNTKRAIANAKIQQHIGQLQLEEITFNLNNALKTTHQLYEIRKQLHNVADEQINSARLSLEISTEKFKSGAINSFNYRDTQLLYQNAAFGKLEAVYNLIDTHSELMRLTGGVISEY